jgi:hypothetical protein
MEKTIRTLTLYQPFASLLAYGIKQNETRPGPTSHTAEKGTYLIHAAKKWTKEQNVFCDKICDVLREFGFNNHDWKYHVNGVGGSLGRYNWNLPLGEIIGSFEVKECSIVCGGGHIEHFGSYKILTNGSKVLLNGSEFSFGDYSEGRSVWIGQNHKVLKDPIPYKGGQGYYQKFKGDINQLKFK